MGTVSTGGGEMIFVQVITGVVLGLAWFTSGVIFPLWSCVKCGKFEVEDYYMIPLCGMIGPIILLICLHSYKRAKMGVGK
jgi:hypothetical protein